MRERRSEQAVSCESTPQTKRTNKNSINLCETDMGVAAREEEASLASSRAHEVLFGVLDPQSSDTVSQEHSSSPTEEKTPIKESALFFLSAVGCTIGWTAVLSNLVYYTDTLGVDSFLFLNLAVYAPLLPVTLAQAIWDAQFDRQFQSLRSFSFRGTVGFSITLICLLLLPWSSYSLVLLSITSIFLGLASAVLHGTLKQMAAFVYPNCGRLPAAVTAGMQASAMFALVVSITSGFGRCADKAGLQLFYYTTAAILVVCWLCFQILLRYSKGVVRSMQRRDSFFRSATSGGLAEPLLLPTGEEASEQASEQELEQQHLAVLENEAADPHQQGMALSLELSTAQLWSKTWPACFAIMITVASSMSVSSWFNRVDSQDPNNTGFPQVLFYTRLLADLLGRPATLYATARPKSIVSLVAVSVLRLGFVPVFFVYTSTSLIPKNDIAAIVGVFAFAFTSGYLATLSYQLAPSLLNDHNREQNSMKQASLINVCFSASVLLGLTASFILKGAIE